MSVTDSKGTKKQHRNVFVTLLCVALGMACAATEAADLLWDANGATAGQTDGGGTWLDPSQWWDGGANVNWNSGTPDNATIGNGGSGGTITLGTVTAGTVLFTNFSGTYTLSSGTLTNNSGITAAANAGTISINSPIRGAGGLTKLNSGILTLRSGSETNTYTGPTVVNNGILQLGNGWSDTQRSIPGGFAGSGAGSNIELNGGNLKIWWPFTRAIGPDPEHIQFTGGAGGFSFMQADRWGQITFSNSANFELVWGSTYFNPDELVLNEAAANPGQVVRIDNKIDLNGADRTVACNSTRSITSASNNGYMNTAGGRLMGVVRNSGAAAGLIKTGIGELQLNAANTYDGATQVKQGTLEIYGGDDRVPPGSQLILGDGASGSGKFKLNGYNQTLTNGLSTAGSGTDNRVVNGSSSRVTLTLDVSSGTNLFDGTLGGPATDENNFSLKKTGAGELLLAGTNTYDGWTIVEEGALSLTNGDALADSSIVIVKSGAKLAVRSDETVSKLVLGGSVMPEGTWGSTASTATYQNDSYFSSTDTGVLTVDGAYNILLYDNFDAGSLESWTAGDNAGLYTGSTYSYSTNNAARLTDGTITLTDALPLDSLGYTNVTISFSRKIVTGSATRRLYTKYSSDNGTNWTDLGNVTYDGFQSYTLAEGAYTFTDTAKFQFSFYDSGGPICYVDDIMITGDPEYLPELTNNAPTDLTTTSATLNATALILETSRDVYVHWGPTDGTNNPASWANSAYVGSWTNASLVNFSVPTNGLLQGNTYYYAFRASNDTSVLWGSPSVMFGTLGEPTVDNSTGGSAIDATSATTRGELTAGGEAEAWICWGNEDAGTDSTSDWDNAVYIGTTTQGIEFTTIASGLATNATYWYRCYVTNALGTDWSDEAGTFNGTPTTTGGGGASSLAIYREVTAGDTTSTTLSDMTWDTTVREDAAYQLQGDNKSIRILESGRYLCLYNLGIYRNNRFEVAASLSLAGTSLGARGKGTGYTRDGTGPNAWISAAAIFDANANDDLLLQYQRTSDADSTLLANASGITLVKLWETQPFLAVAEDGGGQTHNVDLSFAAITFDSNTVASTDTSVLDHSTSSSTDQIEIKAAGKYLITYSLEFENTAGTRRNANTRLTLDATEIEATRVSGYTRYDNSCADPVCSWVGIIHVASASPGSPAILRLEACSEAADTTADLLSQQASLCITKLPTSTKILRTVLSADRAVEGAEAAVDWPAPDEIDTDVFTYNAGTPSRIEVDKDGDYLFLSSFYTYRVSNTSRSVPRWRWRRNGSTTYDYGIFSQYNRGDEGAEDTWSGGQAGGFVGTNMAASDYIEVMAVDDYNTADANNDYKADRTGLQAVQISSIVGGAGIANAAPTNIAAGSAHLNASLTADAGTNYAVYVHFGTTDGGTNFGWNDGYFSVGSWTNSSSTNEIYSVSYLKTGLKGGSNYWYTFRASNDAGNVWASPSWNFTTALATDLGSVFIFK